MANWDEDTVTMAVEAARDALTGLDRSVVGTLMLASTTAPFADRQNAGIVKEALNLPDQVATLDLGGSQRAGMSALIQALSASAGSGEPVLCVASDKRRAHPASEAELVQGDAAAALLVAPGPGIARRLATHSVSADFVDHFRAAGETMDYDWETRWVRDEGYGKLVPQAVAGALAKAGLKPAQIHAFILPAAAKAIAPAMAKACGISLDAVRDSLSATIGHTGVSHPLLMLVHALESATPGQRIVVAGFGNGCDVAVFEVTEAIRQVAPRRGVTGCLRRRREESNYLKFLAFNGNLRLERGMRAEFDQKQPLTALWRHRRTVFGLVGGRCADSGAIQYPRSDIAVGGAVTQMDDYPLAEKPARIVTFTADALTYSPDPPTYYGMIDFEGGGRMSAEFCDVDGDEIEVGREMRMMFRIKAFDEQRGFIRYFWKAAPVPLER